MLAYTKWCWYVAEKSFSRGGRPSLARPDLALTVFHVPYSLDSGLLRLPCTRRAALQISMERDLQLLLLLVELALEEPRVHPFDDHILHLRFSLLFSFFFRFNFFVK